MYAGTLPVRTLGLWLCVVTIISVLNTIRVLGAHNYDSSGAILTRGMRKIVLEQGGGRVIADNPKYKTR